MRFIALLAATLALAACGTTPPPATVAPPRPAVAATAPDRGGLIGLDANGLASRFGKPRLQVREGDGTKLQFAGGSCLLDAYLYPATGGGGVPRVTHVDTRNRDGRSVDQESCVKAIEGQ